LTVATQVDDGLDTLLELNHNDAGALTVETLDVKDVHAPD
jgi:hypothetical protein